MEVKILPDDENSTSRAFSAPLPVGRAFRNTAKRGNGSWTGKSDNTTASQDPSQPFKS